MDNRPIGFFDSGLGGLTCVTHVFNELPKEKVIYFGDTARTPYGSKSEKTIKQFAKEIIEFLIEQNVKMVVIACNTTSAVCFEEIQKEFPQIPLISIIKPAAKAITELCSKTNDIGIIGTNATINNGTYKKEIHAINSELRIFEKATPALVPLIEENIIKNDIMDKMLEYYLDDFILQHRLDTLVLGCTHYQLLESQIRRKYPNLKIINPSKEVVWDIAEILDNENMRAKENNNDNCFYASDLSENFLNMIDEICYDSNADILFKKL